MNLHPIFKLREDVTPQLLELLESVTLGTNGAHYRHLDTRDRIHEADNPLHLMMERNDRLLSNITMCRRNGDWYIRYFAFYNAFQSSGTKKSNNKSGLLRKELTHFFNTILAGDDEYGKAESFYAYIDPNNEKSLWMSENFGFSTIGKIATQTFSRTNPKPMSGLKKTNDWDRIKEIVQSSYENHAYFYLDQTEKPPFYILEDGNGEVLACAKVSTSNWEIKRLPGKMGGMLTKIIPFIPGLNKLIKPKNHTFIVPEAIVVKNNDPELLQQFLEGILHAENKNLILWWVDLTDPLYSSTQEHIKWGLLHKIIGVSYANVVQKTCNESKSKETIRKPVYTAGFDFI
jgi:hypothetical protein